MFSNISDAIYGYLMIHIYIYIHIYDRISVPRRCIHGRQVYPMYDFAHGNEDAIEGEWHNVAHLDGKKKWCHKNAINLGKQIGSIVVNIYPLVMTNIAMV